MSPAFITETSILSPNLYEKSRPGDAEAALRHKARMQTLIHIPEDFGV